MATVLGFTLPVPLDPATNDTYGDDINDAIEGAHNGLGRSQISRTLINPANRTYTIILKSRKPGTIQGMTHKTDAGTLTAAVKINGVAVTGLSAVAVTSSEATTAASAANTVAAGDDIQITLSSVTGVTEFDFNIWIDVTGVGTA